MFLDIELPGINGMGAARELSTTDESTPIIFVTNLAQYALKGYEVDALDFVAKPVSYFDFKLRMDKAMRALARTARRGVTVTTADGTRVVPIADIAYVDVRNHDLAYHLASGETISTRLTLSKAEASFEGNSVIGDAAALWTSTAVVLVLFYFAFARRLERSGLLAIRNPVMFFSVGVAMAVTLILDLAIKDIMVYEMPFRYSVVLSVAYLVICVFILVAEFEVIYNQRLKADVATMERTMAEQERQFDLSRRTIDAINQRVHNIRHHVAGLLAGEGEAAPSSEALSQVVREIDIYDAAVRTGNAALDVVLTEKSLLCRRAGITFSCIADGEALGLLGAAEIYSLFGNAIENAFEAVRQVEDPDQRVVSVMVRRVAGMVSIHVDNPYVGEVRFSDGMPESSKGDSLNHGFGFKSMRLVAERHGGTLTAGVDGQTFRLDALIPME